MPSPKVKCSVDQCTHNLNSEMCGAATISVYNNQDKARSFTSRDTLCKSFHQNKSVGDMVGALHNVNVGGMATSFMKGHQVTPGVECFVNDCEYWGNNNLCHAGEIQIHGDNASLSEDTDCQTFVPRS